MPRNPLSPEPRPPPAPKDTHKVPILVRFDRELLARVDKAAKRRGISRSGWIHYQISQALEADEG